MNPTSELMSCFADDPDGLSARDLETLTAAVEHDPGLAAELKAQLVVAELLAQRFAGGRQDFTRRVRERIRQSDAAGPPSGSAFPRQARRRSSTPRGRGTPQRGGIRTAAWIGAAMAVAVALALLLLAWPAPRPPAPEPVAQVGDVQDAVTLVRDGERFAVTGGADVLAGDRFETPPGGALTVHYPDGTRVEWSGETSAVVQPPASAAGRRVSVERGQVSGHVAPQPPGEPMVFATPLVEATVLGTVLTVEAGRRHTRVTVTEGRVEVRRNSDGACVIVRQNESVTAAEHHRLDVRPLHGHAPAHEEHGRHRH